MNIIKVFGCLLGLVLIVFNFQNCANSSENSSVANSLAPTDTEVPDTTPEPNPGTPPLFKNGDVFNINLLNPSSAMLKIQFTELKYTASTSAKAIAINQNGLGFVSIKNSGIVEEAKRTALQSCFSIGGGLPCALIAVGDFFVISSTELPQSYNYIVSKKSIVDNDMPFATDSTNESVSVSYKNAKSPKALAISVTGNLVSATSNSETGLTDEIVKRLALERCELRSQMSPCSLYAVNDQVVFDPQKLNGTPRINYAQTVVATSIPGLSPARYKASIQDSYLVNLKTLHGTIYLTKSGEVSTHISSVSQADANQKALDKCKLLSSASTCFKYAEKKQIVNLIAELPSYQFSQKIYCGVTPRKDCSAHKLMGCSSQDAYIFATDGVQLVRCP